MNRFDKRNTQKHVKRGKQSINMQIGTNSNPLLNLGAWM